MRARRGQALSRLRRRLAGQPGDVDVILPFDEVVAALGRVGEQNLGLQTIDLDTIVGTVDRTSGFDRAVPADVLARAHALGAHRATPCAAASRCRRSPSTGSARCTSSATATTACRSRGRWA